MDHKCKHFELRDIMALIVWLVGREEISILFCDHSNYVTGKYYSMIHVHMLDDMRKTVATNICAVSGPFVINNL